jgi:hypothetical protein
MTDEIKNIETGVKNMKITKGFFIFTAIAIIAHILLALLCPAYAMWSEALLALAGFVGVIGLTDKYILTNIDIITEIKGGNHAVAITFSALLISFALICFAVVGKG